MQVDRFYLSPAARETLRAHNAAVRAHLALKREERAATEHEFAVETMSGTLDSAATKQDARRFSGEPCTGYGVLA